MAEIFILTDENAAKVDGDALTIRELAETEATANWEIWLSTQSETIQALAAEWAALRNGDRFRFSESVDRQMRKLYVCSSKYGHHESYQSRDHALYLLVDSHRVRAEDRPETRARLVALGHEPSTALRLCQAIGRNVAKGGRMPGAEHDALVDAEIRKLEAEHRPPERSPGGSRA